MKPNPAELIIFRTKDGETHVGGYIPNSHKWECDLYGEKYYDEDVVEWWYTPKHDTGNKNN